MDDSLANSYDPKYKHQVTYFVNARQKTYLNSTEIYIPNQPYERLEDGYETKPAKATQGKRLPDTEEEFNTLRELSIERSNRRTRSTIKDIALSNEFELFATFTFKDGRQDINLCKTRMIGWLKRQRKRDKGFQYIIVPEFHKDNVSLHFHALIHTYGGNLVRSTNPKTGKPLVKRKRIVYDFPNYTLGHSEVYIIGNTESDRIRSGFYLTKYVRKDMPFITQKKRYWRSRGLKKPLAIDNPEEWYLFILPDHVIETDYGKLLYFDNKRIEIFLP